MPTCAVWHRVATVAAFGLVVGELGYSRMAVGAVGATRCSRMAVGVVGELGCSRMAVGAVSELGCSRMAARAVGKLGYSWIIFVREGGDSLLCAMGSGLQFALLRHHHGVN